MPLEQKSKPATCSTCRIVGTLVAARWQQGTPLYMLPYRHTGLTMNIHEYTHAHDEDRGGRDTFHGYAHDNSGQARPRDFELAQLSLPLPKKPRVGGRKLGPLWEAYEMGDKKNPSHRWAFCKACTASVAGTKSAMAHHIKLCTDISLDDKIDMLRKADIIYTGEDGEARATRRKSQAGSNKAINITHPDLFHPEVSPLPEAETQMFEKLILQGTLSANLPFGWVEDQYVKRAFQLLQPGIKLPTKKNLTSMCHAFVNAAN